MWPHVPLHDIYPWMVDQCLRGEPKTSAELLAVASCTHGCLIKEHLKSCKKGALKAVGSPLG